MTVSIAREMFSLPENAPPDLIKQRYSQITWKEGDKNRLATVNMAYEMLLQDAIKRKHGKQ